MTQHTRVANVRNLTEWPGDSHVYVGRRVVRSRFACVKEDGSAGQRGRASGSLAGVATDRRRVINHTTSQEEGTTVDEKEDAERERLRAMSTDDLKASLVQQLAFFEFFWQDEDFDDENPGDN